MAKKLKVNLEDIRVQSFLTSLQDDEKEEVKGGSGSACWTTPWDWMCNSYLPCIVTWDACDEPE
jgi:hypothetical protein